MSSSTNHNKRTVTELLSEFRPGDIVKSKSDPEITGTIKRFEFIRNAGGKTIIVESGDKIFGLKAEDVELVSKGENKQKPKEYHWLICITTAQSYKITKIHRLCATTDELTIEKLATATKCALQDATLDTLWRHKRIVVHTREIELEEDWRIVLGTEDNVSICD